MNRIKLLFEKKKNNVLSIYFTAGHPALNDTMAVLTALQDAGVDMVEIGMPFSDPLADGPVIQESSHKALENGMKLTVLFRQLERLRENVQLPVLLMGYLNPVLHFGFENFCKMCHNTGVDGIILPDLPYNEYILHYQQIAEKYELCFVFLITPQTSEERIRMIDAVSHGFIYMVSSSSTTGIKGSFGDEQISYFKRTQALHLKNPLVVGFGISDRTSFDVACQHAHGAIIGTAFVKMLNDNPQWKTRISDFVKNIK
jgi:tryptophan synthase alpha chain